MIFQEGGSAGDVLMGLSKPSPLPSKDGEILLGRRIAGDFRLQFAIGGTLSTLIHGRRQLAKHGTLTRDNRRAQIDTGNKNARPQNDTRIYSA